MESSDVTSFLNPSLDKTAEQTIEMIPMTNSGFESEKNDGSNPMLASRRLTDASQSCEAKKSSPPKLTRKMTHMPTGWSKHFDENGNGYYVDPNQSAQWEKPPGNEENATTAGVIKLSSNPMLASQRLTDASQSCEGKATDVWEKIIDDESGNPYWYSQTTGESTWIDPAASARPK
jgi:hypothetical protein